MEVRISDSALLPDLLEYFGVQADMVVAQTGTDRLEANILGYGLRGAQLELDLRLRIWESAHAGVTVELLPTPDQAATPDLEA